MCAIRLQLKQIVNMGMMVQQNLKRQIKVIDTTNIEFMHFAYQFSV